MGLLGQIGDMAVNAIKNTVSQGIQGAKAIQPYVNNKFNGLTSAIQQKFHNFVDTVKGIPTLINDMRNIPTFMHDVRNGMRYHQSKQLEHAMYGTPKGSYFDNIKQGYRISKRDRTDPVFHNKLRQHFGMPAELPPIDDKERIRAFKKLINVKRITANEKVKLSLEKMKKEREQNNHHRNNFL